MVAYHFPPLAGSSGIQRTLRFVQQLPDLGWQPLMLTAHSRAYAATSGDLLGDVPAGTVVKRAFALDTARHLQILGRYPGFMARPDRWVSWRFAAVRDGMKLIREFRPQVIWSTYPIATAHLIAAELHRKTGIPWVADFRDPMAQEGYPADPLTHKSYLDIESEAATHAAYCVFTTPGAAQMYRERYPRDAGRMVVIENGYDEESFAFPTPDRPASTTAPARDARITLLHSGIVYPSERDPRQLFMALAQLKREATLTAEVLRIRFRAAVHDQMLHESAQAHGVREFIELSPAIPYRSALEEMLQVDGLLVMQASNCNAQIPAKVYEYLRAGRPILGLTDLRGDTAGVLRWAGCPDIAPLDDVDAIKAALIAFVDRVDAGTAVLPAPTRVREASRRGRAEALARLFDGIGRAA